MDTRALARSETRYSWMGPLLDLVFPRICVVCGAGVAEEQGHVCWECRRRMCALTRPFCEICGNPVHGVVEHEYKCARCTAKRPKYDAARSAVLYDGVAAEVVQELKYGCRIEVAPYLGRLLSVCTVTWYRAVRFDAIVPVPLHRSKLRSRTYNQAQLLAAEAGRLLGFPVCGRSFVRTRPTGTQTELSAVERRVNVRGAFAARSRDWIDGRRLLLVDDVMTTGATVNECARILKEAGAASVHVVTVGRGASPS